jgi:dolichol-phosphate mannosyltransferase
MKKVLVFTGTYNESENILTFINGVFKSSDQVDLLIIDDSSPDGTSEIINSHEKINKELFLIKREKKLGLDTAHKLAYKYAKEKGYEKLITLDADLSHDPGKIPLFIDLLNQSEFVIGSRYGEGAKNNQPLFRFVISYFGNKLIKILLNSTLNEHTTSYRGFDLIKLKNFDLDKVNAAGYSFFMGTIHALKSNGHTMMETPIIFSDRLHGVSKIPKIEIFRTFFNLLKFFFTK